MATLPKRTVNAARPVAPVRFSQAVAVASAVVVGKLAAVEVNEAVAAEGEAAAVAGAGIDAVMPGTQKTSS